MMRKMEVEKLLKTLPVLQTQVDALLDFEVTADELRNGVINGAFLLLFKVLPFLLSVQVPFAVYGPTCHIVAFARFLILGIYSVV